jgi:condensin complex subunit 1
MMCQLPGSTNKAEVLENEEFFRIAWEYQFDGAEMSHSNAVTYSSDVPHARVNSSLQLIWLVDGGRRQRTQGRSLTPAGVAIAAFMKPTQQVNHIAKNMIECTPTFFLI